MRQGLCPLLPTPQAVWEGLTPEAVLNLITRSLVGGCSPQAPPQPLRALVRTSCPA